MLRDRYGDDVLSPVVPKRTIVREAREAGTWYGGYDGAAPVNRAYAAIVAQILTRRLKEIA